MLRAGMPPQQRGGARAAWSATTARSCDRSCRETNLNLGSVRALERNGFVSVGSEDSFAPGRQATVTKLI